MPVPDIVVLFNKCREIARPMPGHLLDVARRPFKDASVPALVCFHKAAIAHHIGDQHSGKAALHDMAGLPVGENTYNNPADAEHVLDGMRKAGLPD
jgi:hypothetical protein